MCLLQGKNPLQKVHWLRLVLDEGHTVRNPKTLMTKAVLALNAERKWVVTGEFINAINNNNNNNMICIAP